MKRDTKDAIKRIDITLLRVERLLVDILEELRRREGSA